MRHNTSGYDTIDQYRSIPEKSPALTSSPQTSTPPPTDRRRDHNLASTSAPTAFDTACPIALLEIGTIASRCSPLIVNVMNLQSATPRALYTANGPSRPGAVRSRNRINVRGGCHPGGSGCSLARPTNRQTDRQGGGTQGEGEGEGEDRIW